MKGDFLFEVLTEFLAYISNNFGFKVLNNNKKNYTYEIYFSEVS
jgi:hypothetical protein